MVIRALIRARLLGMQLLTLEARVVVETAEGRPGRPAPLSLYVPAQAPSSPGLEPGGLELSPGLGSGYGRAIELLEQGAKTLDHHA
jgi:hypothetical protein